MKNQAQVRGLVEGAAVAELLHLAIGDPRLTAWEAQFLASIKQRVLLPEGEPDPDHRLLSAKQIAVLERIAAKLEKAPEEEPD